MLLLTIIYIAFVGLGLPDSMFGTAWPAIYGEWGLPLSYGSFVVSIIYCCTMISCLMSARVIKRFGTAKVTASSTAITALAMAGFAVSETFAALCICAIPLGLGAGAIDTALNNYVASHYSARVMNYLHCFYGVGIVASPYILSQVMDGVGGWKNGYITVAVIQGVIALMIFLTLGVWKKDFSGDEDVEVIPIKKLASSKKVRLMWGLFVTTCAIEGSVGSFGSTYLVEQKRLAAESAAKVIIFYYAGITAGRFLAGLISSKIHVWKIIVFSQAVLFAGLLMLALCGNAALAPVAFLLIGAGNGPMFPNFNFITPMVFGERKSVPIIGSQMAVASLTFMTAPVVCGFVGQIFGMVAFPYFLLTFFALMTLIIWRAGKAFWG